MPSAAKTGEDSPARLRVRRAAGRSPAGSTSHSDVTCDVRSGERPATTVTSRRPSGLRASPDRRGRATYASRSAKALMPPCLPQARYFAVSWPVDSAAMNASCGTSTRPTIFMRFLPSFCFSSSLRLRVMSPP